MVKVAEWFKALDCDSGQRGFKSRPSHNSAKAPAFDLFNIGGRREDEEAKVFSVSSLWRPRQGSAEWFVLYHLSRLQRKEGCVMAKSNKPWGVEFRNGGWLSADTMRQGTGSSTNRKNAYRFSTKEEAEKEAADWGLAGGMAKLVDGALEGNLFVVCLNNTKTGELSKLKVFDNDLAAVEYYRQLLGMPSQAGVVINLRQSE